MNEKPTQETSPITPQAIRATQTGTHAHLGPILGILLILLVLVAMGLWLWGSVLVQDEPLVDDFRNIENNEPETPRAVADMQIFGTMSSSDEMNAIEADVMSTNLDSFDSDLTSIDAELKSSLE